MSFKRSFSAMLSILLLITMGLPPYRLVRATELEIVQSEPPKVEMPMESLADTVPAQTCEPTETTMERVPPESEVLISTLPAEQTEALEITEPILTATEPPDTVTQALAFDNILETIAETEPVPNAGSMPDDLSTVSGQGISFRLFNYSTNINKSSGGNSWRAISSYFAFRNSHMENGTDATTANIPSPNVNPDHDQDGFTKGHATVQPVLDNGYPVLDLSRNADGSARTDPGMGNSTLSLRYLFSSGDHAVTAYSPVNTILQRNGSHYWYDSADQAVDYDISANRFRLRSYPERNSITAGYGAAYGDFLPFTYTGGVIQGSTEDGVSYHVDTENTDYWFGMTMQVNFFQTKDGRLGDENMVFKFSGDDDVWVFVDDVLVLDLGGTHGTVNGSINFATGEVLQYLSWNGANSTAADRTSGSSTSFPRSIRACFDAAGRTPNGGWSADGQTFADYTEHTLKFFYLERGAAVANCSLDFRLPTLPDKSLTVTKDLSAAADSQLRDYIGNSLDYSFRVMKAEDAGNVTEEPFITAAMTYELLENGVKIGNRTVDEDHCFHLKAGQSAQFTQMLLKGNGATRYIVEEIMPEKLTGQYAGVEYLVSGNGGNTITENHPEESFAAFQTGILSAEQTQTVTFLNRVDTRKLGTLKITKLAAPGTQIPADLFFQIQVKIGGALLPVGSQYRVSEELRTVETAGVLFLRANETAVIEQGILAGSEYRVTELSASFDGYRPTYSGAVEPSGEINCTQDGVSGVFPLAGTVHVTIENADYDFAVQVPIYKTVLDFQEKSSFHFLIEQVEKLDGHWLVVDTLPECIITATGAQPAEEIVTIGYSMDTEGVFHYRISEKQGNGNYIYDPSVYYIEVTVTGNAAEITDIKRNDSPSDAVCFVNRTVTELTVTKTVTGITGSMKFPFTVEVFLNGERFNLPEPDADSGYTVNKNVASFSLGHGDHVTIPCIPVGALVKVEEHEHEGFLVSNDLESVDESQISGTYREISFTHTAQTIHFTNQSGFRLPNTGGMGTNLYTIGGSVFSLSMSMALLHKQSRKKGRKRHTPEG